MRIGAVFPHHDFDNSPDAIARFALGIEELGFDHLLAYDHVLGAEHADRVPPLNGPYDESHGFREVLVLFGYLAAITSRLELTVGVLVAPQRQTALIAKQAAEVQLLSRGRLRLGLGTGWNHVEYQSLGSDFDRRGEVLDDQVNVLRQLWSKPVIDLATKHHHIPRAGITPLPEPAIPVWFGGYSPPAYRRSASQGEGHIFGHLDERAIDGARALTELRREAGDDRPFGLDAVIDVHDDPERRATDGLRHWGDIGGTHLTLRTMGSVASPHAVPTDVDRHLELLDRALSALRRG